VMTFVLSLGSGMLLARMHQMGVREGLNTAAIFVNRGEFTLILATLSVSAGLDQRLQPFAGLYVLTMAILGPLFTANSEKIGAAFGRRAKAQHPPARSPERDAMQAEEIALVEAATQDQATGDPMMDFISDTYPAKKKADKAGADEHSGDYS
jgi:CPA2 family monovalent cation:H+ antiporter-2